MKEALNGSQYDLLGHPHLLIFVVHTSVADKCKFDADIATFVLPSEPAGNSPERRITASSVLEKAKQIFVCASNLVPPSFLL